MLAFYIRILFYVTFNMKLLVHCKDITYLFINIQIYYYYNNYLLYVILHAI